MSETPIFEMSPDTRLLRQRLHRVMIDEVITYEALSSEISKPVSGSTSSLHSARGSLLRKDHMVFAAIKGVGLKRLNDVDIVAASDQDVTGIRRRAKKAVRKLTSIQNYNAMPPGSRLQHTTKVSVLAAIADMSTDKSMQKVEKSAVGRSSELPFADTIKAFLT